MCITLSCTTSESQSGTLVVLSLLAVGCRRKRCPQTKTHQSKCVPASVTQRSVMSVGFSRYRWWWAVILPFLPYSCWNPFCLPCLVLSCFPGFIIKDNACDRWVDIYNYLDPFFSNDACAVRMVLFLCDLLTEDSFKMIERVGEIRP